jgi:hypothetical protein
MLRQGPISLLMHAAAEPLLAALFIAAPFLFGFSDQGAPTATAIVAGVVVLLIAMSTQWRLSLIKAIPIAAHLVTDLVIAVVLIAAPFLFGFSDQSAPTAFFIVMGVVDLLATLGTRWYPAAGTDGSATGGSRFRRGRGSGTGTGTGTDSDPQPTA